MKISPCPNCGRTPVIIEGIRIKNYKNGARRRFCRCPNFCTVIPRNKDMYYWPSDYSFSFEYDGDGDDNTIYKLWNEAVSNYTKN